MSNKRGDMIFADMFSIFFTIILLVGFVIYFLVPGASHSKQEEIEIKELIYGNENIFVLKSFLDTPIKEGKVSDLVNLWLVDNSNEARLIEVSQEIFDKVYGGCYNLKFGNILNFGKSNFHDNKGICIDYPNYKKEPIQICLDISDYDEKFKVGEEEECF